MVPRLVYLLALLVILGCDDNTQSPGYWYANATVDSVKVIRQGGLSADLELYGELSNGCRSFANHDVTYQAPDSFLVKVGMKIPAMSGCAAVITPYTDTLTLDAPRIGTYGVRFYNNSGTTLIWELTF